MAKHSQPEPTFSPGRKWTIGFDVVLRTAVVLAVVGMVIYVGGRYPHRFHVSSHTRVELSPLTKSLLDSITNEVKLILYYDKDDRLYSTVAELAREYRSYSPRIQVVTVDYRWDAGDAQKIKTAYKLPEASDEKEKNLVIFDCGGRSRIANGKALADFKLEQLPNDQEREFRRRLTAFNGERKFNECLLAVTSPKQLKAYFLQGHGEHNPRSGDELSGYLKFAGILDQNDVRNEGLTLTGTNTVPLDCNLLIVAGPTKVIPEVELEKINKYLDEGGRMLALFNSASRDRLSGLERVLIRRGVIVGESEVRDTANSLRGADLVVGGFSQHPVVKPLLVSEYNLNLIMPRPVGPAKDTGPNAPKVSVLMASQATAVLAGDPTARAQQFPLAVAVEKAGTVGLAQERGSMRMVVVGDSYFLANAAIELYANRDFAEMAINWLLDRSELLEGVGSRPVTEFRIHLTKSQFQSVSWILLGAMPGTILALGGLVWLRRRK
jgi:hypothetical protein